MEDSRIILGSLQEYAGWLDFTASWLVHPLMFLEIDNTAHLPTLTVFPDLNPAYARKLIEASGNLLGIFQEWEKRTSKDGWIREKISLIVCPIE